MQSFQKIDGALLRDFTTFQIGGPCRALYSCATPNQLQEAVDSLVGSGEKFIVIGQGSNLLVSDSGLDVSVVRYFSETPLLELNGNRVSVSGSTKLDDFANGCIDAGLGDVVFCSGIPGTVGGAIAGNAGAFGQQIGDVLESVELLSLDGKLRVATAEELSFSYRNSELKKTGEVVVRAHFKLSDFDRDEMQKRRAEIMQFRIEKHPDWRNEPCAGSFFRNVEPTSKVDRRQAAGYFLEQSGAMGRKIGDAYVFEKHANMLIGGAGATAQDVFELSSNLQRDVFEKFGIELVREVMLLGDFS